MILILFPLKFFIYILIFEQFCSSKWNKNLVIVKIKIDLPRKDLQVIFLGIIMVCLGIIL